MAYVIRNGAYHLSTRYEKAAEMVLGYGGVWTKQRSEFKRFASKADAQEEIKKMRKAGTGRDAIIEEYR